MLRPEGDTCAARSAGEHLAQREIGRSSLNYVARDPSTSSQGNMAFLSSLTRALC